MAPKWTGNPQGRICRGRRTEPVFHTPAGLAFRPIHRRLEPNPWRCFNSLAAHCAAGGSPRLCPCNNGNRKIL
jgi:hypothetical protein